MSNMISVIIPAYNESGKIKKATEETLKILNNIIYEHEVIIAEDGSNDGTYEIAIDLAAQNHRVRLLHSKEKLGRGMALNKAIRDAKGDIVCYIDADLATDMAHLPALIDAIRYDGYDFAIGSRLMPDSRICRSFERSAASKSYNCLVRLLLKSNLYDHQCGFKAFKRNSVLPILNQTSDRHWFWDTEVLVRGQKEGYKIKEIPVKWNAPHSTKVHLVRDSWEMGSNVIKLWLNLVKEKK